MRIAVIGGTFDPIHMGHLAMAKHVLRHHLVDEVWFMVAQETPLKERKISSFHDRAAMCERAVRPYRHMKVCTLEQELPGMSYTIRTVKELKKRWPAHTFVWLIGGDQAAQLDKWKDIEQLVNEIQFFVFPRNQETITCSYPYTAMQMQLMDVSSSDIRQGYKRWMLPKAVQWYIAKHYLYIEEAIAARMSEKRYNHSKSVAQLCVQLAKAHHVDVQKAYAAGILHDICKEWSKDRSLPYMRKLFPKYLEEAVAIWHGYVGSAYIKHALAIYDKEILQAIFHHVKGSKVSSLAMIVFISDKLDPSRGYDSSASIAICMKHLKHGYEVVKQEQLAYLKKEK